MVQAALATDQLWSVSSVCPCFRDCSRHWIPTTDSQAYSVKHHKEAPRPWYSLHRSLSLVQHMDHRAEQQSDISSLALLHPPPPPPPSQLDSTSAAALGLSRSTSCLCKDVTLLHVLLGLSRSTSDLCKDVTLLHVSLGLSRSTSDLC